MANGVKFIRVRGRIVPIRGKTEDIAHREGKKASSAIVKKKQYVKSTASRVAGGAFDAAVVGGTLGILGYAAGGLAGKTAAKFGAAVGAGAGAYMGAKVGGSKMGLKNKDANAAAGAYLSRYGATYSAVKKAKLKKSSV